MKHTAKAGPMPNASVDFNKVHDNARAGKKDIYDGAVLGAPPKEAAAESEKVPAAAAPETGAGSGKGD